MVFRLPLWVFMLCVSALSVAGEQSFDVDSDNSYIRILTDKSGFFGAMAHYHVIKIKPVSGAVKIADSGKGKAHLIFRPEQFIVDADEDTVEFPSRFKKPVSENSSQSTRRNMLGKKLLKAENFPEILVEVHVAETLQENVLFELSILLQDQLVVLSVPGTLQRSGNSLLANATFSTSLPELGLPLFKVIGGGISVGKDLQFYVHISADLVGGIAE